MGFMSDSRKLWFACVDPGCNVTSRLGMPLIEATTDNYGGVAPVLPRLPG